MSVVTEETRSSLQQNKNVRSVTKSNIRYTPEFMKSALEQYKAGVIGRLIWENAGFNIEDFHRDYFRKVLKRWESQSQKAVDSDWTSESRGKKKQTTFSSLEEELEYLRAENQFLKEVRALGKKSK